MSAFLFISGLLIMTGGAELLVRGAVDLANRVGISSLVIGLTVVAFGTSAPELAVSVKAGLSGQGEIALGNVLGSNVFNVLFILGLSAVIVPLRAGHQLIRLDVPVMIGLSVLVWGLAADGTISRMEGVGLCAGLVVYLTVLIVNGRKEQRVEAAVFEGGGSTGVRPARKSLLLSMVLVGVGLVLLVFGARWLVDGAVELVRALGVSDMLIGVTIVAAGTSMPEVVTSIMASVRGQRDIAIGNVVGSNIFNLLGVMGATGWLAPAGIPISEEVFWFDFPVMIGAAIACLPIFMTHGTISRQEGLLFGFYYVIYVVYVILMATGHGALDSFGKILVWFVIPLTGIGLMYRVYTSRGEAQDD